MATTMTPERAEQILLALQAAQNAAQDHISAPAPPISGFRRFIGIVMMALAGVALTANAVVLGHFGWQQGIGEIERYVLCTAGVLSPILCAVLHPTYIMTWRPGHFKLDHRGISRWKGGRPAWGLLFALSCLTVVSLLLNFAGGIGVMSTARKTVELKAADAIDESRRLKERHAQTKKSIDAIPSHRPTETVKAEIDAHRLHRFWKVTENCAENSVLNKAHRDYCRDHSRLQSELASSKSASSLRTQLAELDTLLANPMRSELAAGTAQMEAISRNTGMSTDLVQARISLLFPLLLELMVIVPMWIAMVAFRIDHRSMQDIPVGTGMQPIPPSRHLPKPEAPRPLRATTVDANDPMPRMFATDVIANVDPIRQRAVFDEFWTTAIRHMSGNQIAEPNIYQHYVSFAIKRGVKEYDMITFRRHSTDHCQMAEINNLNWYYGVGLA